MTDRIRLPIGKVQYNKHDKQLAIFLAVNFLLVVISAVRNIILHGNGMKPELFCDHVWIYRECVYALRGLDISEAIKNGITLEGVGTVSLSSTWPWTKVLGVVVHGAFLDEEASFVYEIVFYAILVSVLCIAVCRRMFKTEYIPHESAVRIQTIFLLLSSWYYVYLVCAFNNGSFVCIAIIIALTLIEDKPVLSGIFMAFAMIKAQIAIPFFVVFLLRKKWRVICTSASVVLLSWATCCILTDMTPWKQIENLLTGQMGASGKSFLRFGMFDFIMLIDDSKALTCMILSAITGLIILVIVETKCVRENLKNDYVYLSYYDAAIVSLLWMYTTKCDYLILTVVALGAFEMWQKSNKETRIFLPCFGIMACSLMNPTNILVQVLSRFGIIDTSMGQPLEGRFDTILLLGLLVFVIFFIHRHHANWALNNSRAA